MESSFRLRSQVSAGCKPMKINAPRSGAWPPRLPPPWEALASPAVNSPPVLNLRGRKGPCGINGGLSCHPEACSSDNRAGPLSLAQPIPPPSPHLASQAPFELVDSGTKAHVCLHPCDIQDSLGFQPGGTPSLTPLPDLSPHPVPGLGLGAVGTTMRGVPSLETHSLLSKTTMKANSKTTL